MLSYIFEQIWGIMKKYVLILLVVFTLISLTEAYSATSPQKAPGIALQDSKGSFFYLSKEIKKSNLIIAFWSTTCINCPAERQELLSLEEKYGKSNNFKVIFINTDQTDENNNMSAVKQNVLNYIEENNITQICLMDNYGMVVKNYEKLIHPNNGNSITLPQMVLIDKNGNIALHCSGYSKENMKKLEEAVKRLK